jgi:hypothetical protein
MNGDALSDLLLAVACAVLAARARPGMRLSIGLVGVAAFCGVLRYSGVAAALGPHGFFSLLAACAGLPLLGASLAWPDSDIAARYAGAARFLLFASGLALLLTVRAPFLAWPQVAPGAAVLLMLGAALRDRAPLVLAGAALLASTFALFALHVQLLPHFNGIQQLHVLMAAALTGCTYAHQLHQKKTQRKT